MENFNQYLLFAAVFAPFAFAAVALCAREGKLLFNAAVFLGFALPFCAALDLWAQFACFPTSGWRFLTLDIASAVPQLPLLGLNGVSMAMFALAGVVGFAAGIWAMLSKVENARLYCVLLLVMTGGLMGAFASVNVLWMYMFHEFALVPTFLAICIWGGAGRRTAAMEMAVYLTLGALISLVGIIVLYSATQSFNLIEMAASLEKFSMKETAQIYAFPFLLFGLGILVSLFPFHSWAPRAYSAAPTSFAMLHAGVLKKFGLYLLIQVAVPLMPLGAESWMTVLAYLALCNVRVMGLITMAQRDLKMMVSYSSVSHMGICFLGIASMSVLGAGGAVLMMFGHGLSVALLFLLSNIIVNRTGQWNMLWMGGLYKTMPVLACFFMAAILATIGLPGFANFWGELSVLLAVWKFDPVICALAATGIIISAVYGLRAVARIFFGAPDERLLKSCQDFRDITWEERIPALLLLAALLAAGFCPWLLTDSLNAELSALGAYAANIK